MPCMITYNMDETEYDLSSQSIMNFEHLATRASRKQEIDFKVVFIVQLCFSVCMCVMVRQHFPVLL